MALFKRGNVWWYEFMFAGRRIQESAKTRSKTVARLAEQKRRRELEEGFNNLSDTRRERIKTFRELASAYLEDYVLRRRRSLKLPVEQSVGKAFDGGEKAALLKAAATLRSPAIYPALMLALNAGMRDAEIRNLRWDRLDLKDAVLAVGRSKTAAGEG